MTRRTAPRTATIKKNMMRKVDTYSTISTPQAPTTAAAVRERHHDDHFGLYEQQVREDSRADVRGPTPEQNDERPAASQRSWSRS